MSGKGGPGQTPHPGRGLHREVAAQARSSVIGNNCWDPLPRVQREGIPTPCRLSRVS